MNKLLVMKIHALLAALILPVALLFMVTGALYTWGVKGSYSSEVYEIALEKPLTPDRGPLLALAESELKKIGANPPEGQAALKIYGTNFVLEWTGSSKDLLLEPTAQERVATLTVKKTSLYRNLVQLHKAKGGIAFKIYAAFFAFALLGLLVSGYLMAWTLPKIKRLTLVATLIGLASFVLMVLLS